ncbi:MAG: hypothetical protein ABI183_18100 [Polyangiaceae bacterium]
MSSSRNAFAERLAVSHVPPAPESSVRCRAREGHDRHFLSRLDRLNDGQVELALTLYRDAPLVKVILLLHAPDFGDRTKRVAISLDQPEQGPFIIVSCAGHFVTCLACGMRVGRRPIITRKKLDATIAYVGDLRAWADAAKFNRG